MTSLVFCFIPSKMGILMPTLQGCNAQKGLAHNKCSVNSSRHNLLLNSGKPLFPSRLPSACFRPRRWWPKSGWFQHTQKFEFKGFGEGWLSFTASYLQSVQRLQPSPSGWFFQAPVSGLKSAGCVCWRARFSRIIDRTAR